MEVTQFTSEFNRLDKTQRAHLVDYLFGWFCGYSDTRTDEAAKQFRKAVCAFMAQENIK